MIIKIYKEEMLLFLVRSLFLCVNLKQVYKIKIWKEDQLNLLKGHPEEVVDSVNETIRILNNNYEYEKNEDQDLGCYIELIRYIDELKKLKNYILATEPLRISELCPGVRNLT